MTEQIKHCLTCGHEPLWAYLSPLSARARGVCRCCGFEMSRPVLVRERGRVFHQTLFFQTWLPWPGRREIIDCPLWLAARPAAAAGPPDAGPVPGGGGEEPGFEARPEAPVKPAPVKPAPPVKPAVAVKPPPLLPPQSPTPGLKKRGQAEVKKPEPDDCPF